MRLKINNFEKDTLSWKNFFLGRLRVASIFLVLFISIIGIIGLITMFRYA